MSKTLSLIRSSWDFFRKQPALTSVAAWLFFVPTLAVDALTAVSEGGTLPEHIRTEASIGIAVLIFLLSLVTIWGQCCVYVAGRRMLQTKAGRSRTSFRATASQAKAFIIPFILTNILRTCFTLLWGLLLIVPGVVYALRTSFASVAVIGENTGYRAALERSKQAVKGNAWPILGQLILLTILLFAIPLGLIAIASLSLPDEQAYSYAATFVVQDVWLSVATVLMGLSLMQMYEKYRVPMKK